MRIGLAAAAAFLLACGKEPSRQRTATSGNASPATKAPPATPSGVIGCNDLTLAVPDESKTDLIVVTIDAKAYGLEPGAKLTVGLAFRSGVTAYLERYERPITGETHCTDLGTEPQTPVRYAAVAGRVTIEIVKDPAARPPAWPTYLVNAVFEDARFVDAKASVIDVPRRSCANVQVGWRPGG